MKRILLQSFALACFLNANIGCKQISKLNEGAYIGPFYTVGNVYMNPTGLDKNVRRIAVLPLIPSRGNRDAERGVPFMQPILTEEFSRNRIFDVVTITPDRLKRLFHRRSIYADEPLPYDFLATIHEETGCQAILFAELTTFRAYPPVALGWKLHLFDLGSEELIWAVDEVFDGGQSPVANSLRRHIRRNHASHGDAATKILVLDSPREMARFSLSQLTPTLMKKNPKVAINPAEANSNQKVSGEPDLVGPKPVPPDKPTPEGPKNLELSPPDSGAI